MDGQQPPGFDELRAKAEKLQAEAEKMVNDYASEVWHRFPWTTPEDLKQAGWEGYLKAQRTFDPSKGAALSTFVAYRVHGAMLDMGRDEARARRLVNTLHSAAIHESEDAPPMQRGTRRIKRTASAFMRLAMAIDEAAPDPEALCAKEQALQKLRENLDLLPPQERKVIDLEMEGRSNKEIAAALDLQKSTVSHHRESAIGRLRRAIEPPTEEG